MTSGSATTSSTSPRSSADHGGGGLTAPTGRSALGNAGPLALGDGPVRAWWSGRAQGDQRRLHQGGPAPSPVPDGLVVHRLTQVHGAGVVVVDGPPAGPEGPGSIPPTGDALVSAGGPACLVVLTADCVALALGSPEGVHAAVHVGWRGLAAGVVQRAADAMRVLGAGDVVAGAGPCIGPCCYEFGHDDLRALTDRYGPGLAARTTTGRPALDLIAGVRAALGEAGGALVHDAGRCTSCGGDAFSHRGAGDDARQAVFVWRAAS